MIALLPLLAAAQPHPDSRTTATPRLPRFGDPDAELIGLLEIPTLLAGENGATPSTRRALTVFNEPGSSGVSTVVKNPRQLVTREAGYELAAVVVHERRDAWYRIALAPDRTGWIRANDAGTFHPVAELLTNRLTYLNDHWDGWIWPASGAGHPQQAAPRNPGKEQPVRILASEKVGDSLWLQIELLHGDPCGATPPKVVHAGWIPAYTPTGQLTAWFYSRGC